MFLILIGIILVTVGLTLAHRAKDLQSYKILKNDPDNGTPFRDGKIGDIVKKNPYRLSLAVLSLVLIIAGLICFWNSSTIMVSKGYVAISHKNIKGPGIHFINPIKRPEIIQISDNSFNYDISTQTKDFILFTVKGIVYYNIDPICYSTSSGLLSNMNDELFMLFSKHLAEFSSCKAALGNSFNIILDNVNKDLQKSFKCVKFNVNVSSFGTNRYCEEKQDV